MGHYTLKDLEEAKSELARWSERFENYSVNNPNKYQSDIKIARAKVRLIEWSLKDEGVLPKSEYEKLEETLDHLHPDAQSKQIVEYEGHRYQRQFTPLEKSNSGKTVTAWGRSWVKVSDEG